MFWYFFIKEGCLGSAVAFFFLLIFFGGLLGYVACDLLGLC